MIYYKVKPEYHLKPCVLGNRKILLTRDDLYTEREKKYYGIPDDAVEIVELSRKEISFKANVRHLKKPGLFDD